MEKGVKSVNRQDVLRYLGYRGGEVPAEVQEQIIEAENRLLSAARPRVSWRIFPLLPNGQPEGCTLRLEGQDIRKLLAGCGQVILMAATLGNEAELLLMRTQRQDMALSAVMDAVGSAAVESVCDALCEELSEKLKPKFLTDRFSPGYGDFPLSQQAEICSILEVSKRIGIYLSGSGMMIPQKSVTAVVGVADAEQPKRRSGCAGCAFVENCVYPKEGKSCGDF